MWVKHSSNDHGQKWSLVKKAYLLGSCWSPEYRNCANSVCVTRRCLTAVRCFCILIQSVGKVRTYLAFFKEETERHSRELMTQPCMARNQNMRVKKTFNPTFSDQDVSWKRQLLTFWPEISTDLVNMNTFLYGSVTVLSKINPPRASTKRSFKVKGQRSFWTIKPMYLCTILSYKSIENVKLWSNVVKSSKCPHNLKLYTTNCISLLSSVSNDNIVKEEIER